MKKILVFNAAITLLFSTAIIIGAPIGEIHQNNYNQLKYFSTADITWLGNLIEEDIRGNFLNKNKDFDGTAYFTACQASAQKYLAPFLNINDNAQWSALSKSNPYDIDRIYCQYTVDKYSILICDTAHVFTIQLKNYGINLENERAITQIINLIIPQTLGIKLNLGKNGIGSAIFEQDCKAPAWAQVLKWQIKGDKIRIHILKWPDNPNELPPVFERSYAKAANEFYWSSD